MKRTHTTKGSDVVVVDETDPYITYNNEMKQWASNLFQEAEKHGWTSVEDKARYLSGKIFELSPFGLHKGIFEKDSIELFNGLMSNDKSQHNMACINKAILQRGLLESQGVRTRNHMYQIVPFSYAFKPDPNAPNPVLSKTIKKMNRDVAPLVKTLIQGTGGFIPTFPHATTDVCTQEDEAGKCLEWKTLDATFDDTTRMLKVRPIPDKRFILGEATPKTVKEWSDKYVTSSPAIHFLLRLGQIPPFDSMINWIFQQFWFNPLMEANEHIKDVENNRSALK